MTIELSESQKKLLRTLEQNENLTYEQLAEKANLSYDGVRGRVSELISSGVNIQKFRDGKYTKLRCVKKESTPTNRILIFDIETSPNLGYVWGKWEQNVISYEHEWYMLSFAYKWLGEKEVHAYALPDFKNYEEDKENDYELLKKLHALMSEADVIIAHNGDHFDVRKTNARFIAHGLTPPEPYKTIDTKKVAKKHFFFNSNSLTDLGTYLGVGEKIQTGGFALWKGCMTGDKESWKKMVDYNKQDVLLLEKVYNIMLPWITNHPNRALMDGKSKACPNCSSESLQKRGFNFTRVGKYQRYFCTDCGGWSSERRADTTAPRVLLK